MEEKEEKTIEKSSDEILKEMFKSIAPESLSEAETVGSSAEENEEVAMKSKKRKKEKKEKKKKKRKKKHKHKSGSRSKSPKDPDSKDEERNRKKHKDRDHDLHHAEDLRKRNEIYYPGDDRLKIKSHRESSHRDSRRHERSRSRQRSRSRDRSSKNHDDPFWESKWEAMQVQNVADKKELKGKHFLDPEKKEKKSTVTPESVRESSPETSELKQINRLNEIKNLVVKADEIYVAEPPNPDLFEWDERLKMRRKKMIPVDLNLKKPTQKVETSKLTLDEIEEMQKKKRRHPNDRGLGEKEDGEIHSDEERRSARSKRQRRSKTRSRSRERSRRRSPFRSTYHDRRRERSRSRDRFRYGRRQSSSRTNDGFRGSRSAIDKAKLLAIAQKNAVKLLNSNDLKGMNKDRLVAIKSGGQSLTELTTFCRELARKGLTDEFSDDDQGDSGDEYKIQHPFMVRERALPIPNPIWLGISGMKSQIPSNALTFQNMTPAMKDAARSHRLSEFPVSSGNSHRLKEPSPSEESESQIPTGMIAAQKAISHLVATGDPIVKLLQLEDKSSSNTDTECKESKTVDMANPLGKALFKGNIDPSLPPEICQASAYFEMNSEGGQGHENVFDVLKEPSMDIGDIISLRLNAMKRLSSNQNDSEALKDFYDAQQEMARWACSKNKPGQFTGTTGAKVLSKSELTTGSTAWANQEQFTSAKKVSGGFGEYMLRKMGWREGDGLGREKSGTIDPLQLDIKMDKRGLMAPEESGTVPKSGDVLTLTGLKDISGKHPVSGLIELSIKKKWGAPVFTQVFECGPPHKKNYIWKVSVNGVDYQPSVPCDNKKKAKANAALLALQFLGVVPKDPNNPL